VPQALAASGAAIVFASLYAAYQLYQLLPAVLAFPALAVTAGATVAMALRHGPVVGALGLAGAYAVPALVHGDTASAAGLFAYVTAVGAASLAVVRHRRWWWLAWFAVGGAAGWTLLWLVDAYDRQDTAIIGIFLLVQLAAFAALRRGVLRVGFL